MANRSSKIARRNSKQFYFNGLSDREFLQFVDKISTNISDTQVVPIGSFSIDVHRVIRGSTPRRPYLEAVFPETFCTRNGTRKLILPVVFNDYHVQYTAEEKEKEISFYHVAIVALEVETGCVTYFDNRCIEKKFGFYRVAIQTQVIPYLRKKLSRKLVSSTNYLHQSRQIRIPNGWGLLAAWVTKQLILKKCCDWRSLKLPTHSELVNLMLKESQRNGVGARVVERVREKDRQTDGWGRERDNKAVSLRLPTHRFLSRGNDSCG
ncbi:unnamed protein product [Allacma fusca]|uniref:Uncharacterized protein n=1 Tax=Allacma fusca TaxID=39272 RepID=A0A8J2P587_9HEXA|nr:unnamed protein product [Allacma fusca]